MAPRTAGKALLHSASPTKTDYTRQSRTAKQERAGFRRGLRRSFIDRKLVSATAVGGLDEWLIADAVARPELYRGHSGQLASNHVEGEVRRVVLQNKVLLIIDGESDNIR